MTDADATSDLIPNATPARLLVAERASPDAPYAIAGPGRPIIGWRIDAAGVSLPVCVGRAAPAEHEVTSIVVDATGGQVFALDSGRCFPSLNDWVLWLNRAAAGKPAK